MCPLEPDCENSRQVAPITEFTMNIPKNLTFYMTAIARLGGYLDRKSDPPPGTTVMWRGFSRLSDLDEGFRSAQLPETTFVGN